MKHDGYTLYGFGFACCCCCCCCSCYILSLTPHDFLFTLVFVVGSCCCCILTHGWFNVYLSVCCVLVLYFNPHRWLFCVYLFVCCLSLLRFKHHVWLCFYFSVWWQVRWTKCDVFATWLIDTVKSSYTSWLVLYSLTLIIPLTSVFAYTSHKIHIIFVMDL